MDTKTAKTIPIQQFLQRMGVPVDRVTGNATFYPSPFRNENHASFKLSQNGMAWFDHGTGEGGNIIDLAMRCAQTNDLAQALAFIETVMGSARDYASLTSQHPWPRTPQLPAYMVRATAPFNGYGPGAQWLKARGINPELMRPYLTDVGFNRREKPLATPY